MSWRKVNTSLPTKNCNVFILVNNQHPYNAAFIADIKMFCNDGLKVEDVTHWMPVPDLKEEDKIKLTEIPASVF